MTKTVLITGAKGRLGQAAITAFSNRGWNINTLVRTSSATREAKFDDVTTGDAIAEHAQTHAVSNTQINEWLGDVCDFDSFVKAAQGCEVIVHAANPSYEHWATELPKATQTLIDVAKTVNATIIMPGNVYPYGETMPPLLTPATPHAPSCQHGALRAELERNLQLAAKQQGVQTLLIRAGGYIDGRDTGNWFETYMCKELTRGKFMYPGASDAACAWVYLPDVASVMAQVAEIRSQLHPYEDIGVPGFSVTGDELHRAVESTLGITLKRTSMPWFVLKLIGLIQPKMKAVHDLRYLFFVPHAVDGERLHSLLPQWRSTSLLETLALVFEQQSATLNHS